MYPFCKLPGFLPVREASVNCRSSAYQCNIHSLQGVCISCGRINEPCCPTPGSAPPFCSIGTICTEPPGATEPGVCVPCGERGEACCAGSTNLRRCGTGGGASELICIESAVDPPPGRSMLTASPYLKERIETEGQQRCIEIEYPT